MRKAENGLQKVEKSFVLCYTVIMVKLWIKLIKEDKIIKDVVVEKPDAFDYACFADYLTEGLFKLDEPTPVVIKNHIFDFAKFHVVRFRPSDFVETVGFDYMWVENLDRF